ncbi:hypothetical protein QBC39DRAFT_403252 [Podospora conica]|nr:hypothetical protein QBC39DRAFT_403252 [Schizothecium conicum]
MSPPLSPLSLNPPNLPPPPLPHLPTHRPTPSITPSTTTTITGGDFDFDFAPPLEETTHLLPPPTPKRHTVRVQGQLVLVKSVSVNNLSPAPPSPGLDVGAGVGTGVGSGGEGRPVSGRVYESALGAARTHGGGGGQGRRMSAGAGAFGRQHGPGGLVDETEEERRARKGRDGQLRGYGIGGRGNIRRPTEVAPFGGKKHGGGGLASAPATPVEGGFPKRTWNLREKLGLGVPGARRD